MNTADGLPTGTRITYGAAGFPGWVYSLAAAFGLKAGTHRVAVDPLATPPLTP